MQRILVATDFSARSDRALRRASLLARQLSAALDLIHVVDDDQPPRLLESRRSAASDLLAELARKVREADGVPCDPRIVLGDAFDGILRAGEESSSSLIVIGAHRRQILRDVFVGTTAERIIRSGSRPVLMVNNAPVAPYTQILAPTDLSDRSSDALQAMLALGLVENAAVDALYLFDAPAADMMDRAALPPEQREAYVLEEKARCAQQLQEFLGHAGLHADRTILRLRAGPPAEQICAVAQETGAHVIVMGTRGRAGLSRLVLGSVAEGVLRRSDRDVLAVPPHSEN